MNKLIRTAAFYGLLLIAVCACTTPPRGENLYLAGDKPIALILAHGRGQHPAWLVVEPLRHAVQRQLGYHTLSLQMPNDDMEWQEYADEFPKAYAVIQQGIARLQKMGVTKIYLMGHSMGARMASAFLASHPDAPIAGLIVAGCRNNGDEPLACDHNLQIIDTPVLDIWGAANGKDATAGKLRKYLKSENYQQMAIAGGNHAFTGKESEFVDSVIDWLRRQALRKD